MHTPATIDAKTFRFSFRTKSFPYNKSYFVEALRKYII